MSTIVLRGGTLIDGNGDDPIADAAVRIEDGTITEVGKISSVEKNLPER